MLKPPGLVVCAIMLATIFVSAQQNAAVRKAARPAPGRYIVILNSPDDPESLGLATARLHQGRLSHVFRAATRGFAITLPEPAAHQLARDSRVRLVEEDSIVSVANVQNGVYWGLDRIDQRTLPLDQRYFYPAGSGTVHVHVIDTGIRATHVEFGGRAHVAADYVDDDQDNDPNDIGDDDGVPGPDGADCHGHGTHVAGTVGGETYGVAKSAALSGHRVLDCSGNGFTSSVIAAIDFITASTQRPAAVNMSLTAAGPSQALDEAVRRSISNGVTYVIAAGNDNIDASAISPARVTEAITVGASDSYDVRAGFSNYGAVVDLFAPGQGITSAWSTSDVATAALSGTSMAAPHVAGVAALYLQANPAATPAQVRNALVAAASPVITSAGTGSPNLLIYSGFLLPGDLAPPVVSITAPAPNSVVSGTLSLSATATDNTAVASVQFKLNGSNIGAAVSGPGPTFTSSWNTATAADGAYTISAVATDAAGNSGTSSVAVVVRNTFPPVISALTVNGVTSSGAVVSWTTDKPATSQVAWGIASASTLTPIDSTLVTAHSVVLSGLAASTTYRYAARSADAQGTIATSAELTFTTPSAGGQPVPIGYWAFEDGSGPTAADTSGTGNHGTLTGATFTAGKLAGGVTFSGSGQYLAAAGNNNTTFTTAAWFRTSGLVGTWSGLIEYSTTSGLRRGMALDPTGRPVVAYGAAAYRVATGPRLDDGAWHHLAASYDGTTARVYVDGQPAGLGAAALAGSTSASRLHIGDLAFPGYYFKGVIDEVRLYDRALSAADITAIYTDTGTPADSEAPSVPTGLSATAISSTQINLAWTASTDNSAVTGYKIFRNGVHVATATATQHADSGLAPATAYSYTVAATDAAGNTSTASTAAGATTLAPPDSTPPVAGLIGYWAFEDGSGPTAADTSGTGNHGTLTGATFTAGKLAGGVTFSGNGQYMAAAGNNNTTFTTTAWFRTTGPVGTWSGLIEYSTTSGLRRGMALDPAGRPVVAYGAAYRIATGPRLDDGAWHHLAASYDGTTARVYVDGQPVGLGAASPAGPTSASRLRIGDLAFLGYYFRGVIDQVRLYDRALSPADITAIYTDVGASGGQ